MAASLHTTHLRAHASVEFRSAYVHNRAVLHHGWLLSNFFASTFRRNHSPAHWNAAQVEATLPTTLQPRSEQTSRRRSATTGARQITPSLLHQRQLAAITLRCHQRYRSRRPRSHRGTRATRRMPTADPSRLWTDYRVPPPSHPSNLYPSPTTVRLSCRSASLHRNVPSHTATSAPRFPRRPRIPLARCPPQPTDPDTRTGKKRPSFHSTSSQLAWTVLARRSSTSVSPTPGCSSGPSPRAGARPSVNCRSYSRLGFDYKMLPLVVHRLRDELSAFAGLKASLGSTSYWDKAPAPSTAYPEGRMTRRRITDLTNYLGSSGLDRFATILVGLGLVDLVRSFPSLTTIGSNFVESRACSGGSSQWAGTSPSSTFESQQVQVTKTSCFRCW